MKNTILVTGATGQVENYLVQSLHNKGYQDIVLAVRNPFKAIDSPCRTVLMDYDKPETIKSTVHFPLFETHQL